MPDRPLSPAMQNKWGHLRWLKYKGNDEWSAECPVCRDDGHDPRSGDPDRFMIFGENTGTSGKARGKCRKCGHLEWLDDDPTKPRTPQQQQQDKKERREFAKLQEQKYLERQRWLREQTFWLEYHDNMTAAQRKIWHDAGVGDWAIEIHKLGYSDQDENDALSIPYLNDNEIQSLQFRIMGDVNGGGRYRFLSGTRAEIFRVWPDDPIDGVVLVTEGVKKGIVTLQQGPYSYQGKEVTVVSVPMKNVPERLIEKLSDAELLIWLLDPDAYVLTAQQTETAVDRNMRLAGYERCRMVRTPGKIDDMFMMGLTGKSFQHMLNQAKKPVV